MFKVRKGDVRKVEAVIFSFTLLLSLFSLSFPNSSVRAEEQPAIEGEVLSEETTAPQTASLLDYVRDNWWWLLILLLIMLFIWWLSRRKEKDKLK